ncbi:hypothetical protein F5Y09DRAFT_351418 [Xylaria sp. FL1042]|nr:hypothetical protein F5Y09DRAFT_351418 [Xylaria sp. FL1042]
MIRRGHDRPIRLGPNAIAPPPVSFYLRGKVLLIFAFVFCSLAAVLEVLLHISQKYNGFTDSLPGLNYLWTFGPTALASLIATIWSRLAFQAQVEAPWHHFLGMQQTEAEVSLFLDYTSMIQPFVLLKSLKLRDRAVCSSAVGSIVAHLIVIFASALVVPTWVLVERETPITYQTSFTGDKGNLKAAGSLDYLTVRGIFRDNLTYPHGTTDKFTYQTIEPSEDELRATVTGFAPNLICEPASLNVTQWVPNFMVNTSTTTILYQVFKISIESENCRMNSSFNFTMGSLPLSETGPLNSPLPAGEYSTYFSRLLIGRCDGVSDVDANRLAFLVGDAKFAWDSFNPESLSLSPEKRSQHSTPIVKNNTVTFPGTIPTSIVATAVVATPTQLSLALIKNTSQSICQMSYQMTRLGLVQNGTGAPDISSIDEFPPNRTLGNIHPWDFIEVILASHLALPDIDSMLMDKAGNSINVDKLSSGIFQSFPLMNEDSLFDNLVFFRAAIPNINGSSDTMSMPGVSINTVIPAIRAQLQCKFREFQVDWKMSALNVTGEECQKVVYVDENRINHPALTNTIFSLPERKGSPEDFSFGWISDALACSSVNYAWGHIDNYTSQNPAINASVLSCNETVQVVEVNVTMGGGGMLLDPTFIPRVNETSTLTLFSTPFTYHGFYPPLIDDGSGGQLEPFFNLLTTSRYAIPFNDISNHSKAAEVADAIRFQHGVIRAQTYNPLWRDSTNSNGTILGPNGNTVFTDAASRTADIIIPNGVQRLAQDATATHILVTALAITLALHVLANALAPRKDVLIRKSKNIASVMALLVDGNVFEFLPNEDEVAVESQDIASDYLFANGRVCWLGWRKIKGRGDVKGHFGIWILTPEEAAEAKYIASIEQSTAKVEQGNSRRKRKHMSQARNKENI